MAFPPLSPFDPDFMKKMQILAQIQRDVPGAPPSEVNFLFNKYMNEKPVTNPFEMSSTPPLLPSDIDYNNLSRRERKIYQEQGFDLTPELYAEGVDREKFPRYPSSAFQPNTSEWATIFDSPDYGGQSSSIGWGSNTMEDRRRAFNELLEKERNKIGYSGEIPPDFIRENYGSAQGTIFDEKIDPITQRTLDSYGMTISDYWNLDEDKRKKFNENITYMGGKIPTGEPYMEESDIQSEDKLTLKDYTNIFGNLNPYGRPMSGDLIAAGAGFAGKGFANKFKGATALGSALFEGARSFMTGMGAQKRWNQGEDWYDENIKRTQYSPVSQKQEGYLNDLGNAAYGGLFTQNGMKEFMGGGVVPPGYHRMPDGTIMADSEHYGEYKDGGCYECGGMHKYPEGGPHINGVDPKLLELAKSIEGSIYDLGDIDDGKLGNFTSGRYNLGQSPFSVSDIDRAIDRDIQNRQRFLNDATLFQQRIQKNEYGGMYGYQNGGAQSMNPNMMGAQQPSLKDDPRFQPGEYIEFEYGGKTHKGVIKSNDGESIELE